MKRLSILFVVLLCASCSTTTPSNHKAQTLEEHWLKGVVFQQGGQIERLEKQLEGSKDEIRQLRGELWVRSLND